MIINKRIRFSRLIWFLANRILWRHKDDANLEKIFLETARTSTDLEEVIFAPKQKPNQQQAARPRRTRDENPKAEVENAQKKQPAPPKSVPVKKQKVNAPNQMTPEHMYESWAKLQRSLLEIKGEMRAQICILEMYTNEQLPGRPNFLNFASRVSKVVDEELERISPFSK